MAHDSQRNARKSCAGAKIEIGEMRLLLALQERGEKRQRVHHMERHSAFGVRDPREIHMLVHLYDEVEMPEQEVFLPFIGIDANLVQLLMQLLPYRFSFLEHSSSFVVFIVA